MKIANHLKGKTDGHNFNKSRPLTLPKGNSSKSSQLTAMRPGKSPHHV
ncbi:MAG: hypothetical protein ABR990_09980 [Terracidiphilus sp.]